jgi:hypothetical protein
MIDARRMAAVQVLSRRCTCLLARDFRGWLRASEAFSPDMDISAVMASFDEARTGVLAVLSADHRVLGIVSSYVRRRYLLARRGAFL